MGQADVSAELAIAPIAAVDLAPSVSLYRAAFRLTAEEALPAWVMLTTNMAGGVTLGAFDGERLVGLSYALAAFDGREPYLYSCGLIVRPEYRGRGVGRRMKLVQRDVALEAGYRRMRWTTGSLNATALRLYLNHLGARAVDLLPGVLDTLIGATYADEILVEWDLEAPPRATPLEHGDGWSSVELPWDAGALVMQRPEEVRAWRLRVRSAVAQAFAEHRQGAAVEVDRARRHVLLWFTPAQRA